MTNPSSVFLFFPCLSPNSILGSSAHCRPSVFIHAPALAPPVCRPAVTSEFAEHPKGSFCCFLLGIITLTAISLHALQIHLCSLELRGLVNRFILRSFGWCCEIFRKIFWDSVRHQSITRSHVTDGWESFYKPSHPSAMCPIRPIWLSDFPNR